MLTAVLDRYGWVPYLLLVALLIAGLVLGFRSMDLATQEMERQRNTQRARACQQLLDLAPTRAESLSVLRAPVPGLRSTACVLTLHADTLPPAASARK